MSRKPADWRWPTSNRSLILLSAIVLILAGLNLRSWTQTTGTDSSKPRAPYTRAVESYRAGKIAEAAKILESALREGESGTGIHSLLGWCYLRLEKLAEAEKHFLRARELDPESEEAVDGLIASYTRSGQGAKALEFALDLLEREPGNAKARQLAERALEASGHGKDRRLRKPPRDLPDRPAVFSRAGPHYLEIGRSDGFKPVFVKGVNLGVALPGKYPSEFPQDLATYRTWLRQIAEMGSNVVRLYTLLPPVFYQAVREHNLDRIEQARRSGRSRDSIPDGFLYLIHGVWTGLPENGMYDDPAFEGEFKAEMERVLDALHGNIAVSYRPGHAFGLYEHDVSSMVLAIILGREWESYTVVNYDEARPGGSFKGKHFVVEKGTATELWLARMMDHATEYEAESYGVVRPVTFTNWPTLDPISHPTEATAAEEKEIKKKLGLGFDPRPIPSHNVDEDGIGVDANVMRRAWPGAPGHFASYHAYPYYPDFMILDPEYAKATDHLGPNNYVGYLKQILRHHEGMPVMISEVGVPTSRGVAHDQPQGFEHGGHGEKEQGEINARLMRNIHDTGCAGGILFAWLDEWFKKNWQVMEYESPRERNRKWLNAQDPEQNYGLLAALPGKDGPPVILDGRGADWDGHARIASAAGGSGKGSSPGLEAIWAAHDEAYLYLRVDTSGLARRSGGGNDWSRYTLMIGIDTHGAKAGDRNFPPETGRRAPRGMEFMIRVAGPGKSKILVDPPYDLWSNKNRRPFRSSPNADGIYREIEVELRVSRYGRDGTRHAGAIRSRSMLRRGKTDPGDPEYHYLSDWYDGRDLVELRIPWGLLNVTDPSSRRVVSERKPSPGEVGTVETDGFRIYALLFDGETGRTLDTLPPSDSNGTLASDPDPLYRWEGWEEPSFHLRLKKSYFILRDLFRSLPSEVR